MWRKGKERRGGGVLIRDMGLLQQRRLIREDKGEIRRFKTEKVVCGRCTIGLKCTVGKQTGGEGQGGKTAETEMSEIKM